MGCGACAFGHRSIAHAVADGKRAAWDIHGALTGTDIGVTLASAWVELEELDATREPMSRSVNRRELPLFAAPPADPFSSSALGDYADVLRESTRCLDCTALPFVDDGCTRCGKCVPACPTNALTVRDDAPVAIVNVDLCTRCGACVRECPDSAISMVRAIGKCASPWMESHRRYRSSDRSHLRRSTKSRSSRVKHPSCRRTWVTCRRWGCPDRGAARLDQLSAEAQVPLPFAAARRSRPSVALSARTVSTTKLSSVR